MEVLFLDLAGVFESTRIPFNCATLPSSPFIYIDPHAGRPPRIFQWSVGLQREVARNLVVEAAYVGNRGVWWTAPVLADQAYNAMTPQYRKTELGSGHLQMPAIVHCWAFPSTVLQ
jgi:hypothetical protein